MEENIKILNEFFLSHVFLMGKYFDAITGMENPEKLGYTICNFLKERGDRSEKTLTFRKRIQNSGWY